MKLPFLWVAIACMLPSWIILAHADPLPASAGRSPIEQTLGPALPNADLDGWRGGAEYQYNINNLSADLYNNAASHNITGTNTIAGGAFSSSSGFPTVVQNSGNNVIIQNATIVNLKLQ